MKPQRESRSAVAEALRELRNHAKLSQAAVADRARISRRTVIRWENGDVSPWIPELRAVLDVFQLPEQEVIRVLAMLETNRAVQEARPIDRQAIGSLLGAIRNREELRVPDLAERIGCDPSTIAMWESGRLWPNPELISRAWTVLGVSSSDLDEWEQLRQREPPRTVARREERLLSALWPWDIDSYRRFDFRFQALLEKASDDPSWELQVRAAYGWMLSSSGRYSEAKEQCYAVIEACDQGVQSGRSLYLATTLAARSEIRSQKVRGLKRARLLLDQLEGRPLEWDLLCIRYDVYAEAYAIGGRCEDALDYCNRAAEAAAHIGSRALRVVAFNRTRVLARFGKDVGEIHGFSDFSPLEDASEARTIASVLTSAGAEAPATHWIQVADEIISRYRLERVFARRPNDAWGMLPPYNDV